MAESRACRCRYCQEEFPESLLCQHGGFCCQEHVESFGEAGQRKLSEGGCLWCGESVPLLARLRGERFCSPAHEQNHYRQQAEGILERVRRYRRQGGGSRLRSESAKVIIRPRKENGEESHRWDELPAVTLDDRWREPMWKTPLREPDPAWAHEGRVSRSGRLPGGAYWREARFATRRGGGAIWAESRVDQPVRFAVAVLCGTGRLGRSPLAMDCSRGYHASHGINWMVSQSSWRLLAAADPPSGLRSAPAGCREAYSLRPARSSVSVMPGREGSCSVHPPDVWMEAPSAAAEQVAAEHFLVQPLPGAVTRSRQPVSLAPCAPETAPDWGRGARWKVDAAISNAAAMGGLWWRLKTVESGPAPAEFFCGLEKLGAATIPSDTIPSNAAPAAGFSGRKRAEESSWIRGQDRAVWTATGFPVAPSWDASAPCVLQPSWTRSREARSVQAAISTPVAGPLSATGKPAAWSGMEEVPRWSEPRAQFVPGLAAPGWNPPPVSKVHAVPPAFAAIPKRSRPSTMPGAEWAIRGAIEMALSVKEAPHGAAASLPPSRLPARGWILPRTHAGAGAKRVVAMAANWTLAETAVNLPAPTPAPFLLARGGFWPACSFAVLAHGCAVPAMDRPGAQRYKWQPAISLAAAALSGAERRLPRLKCRGEPGGRLNAVATATVRAAPGVWALQWRPEVIVRAGMAGHAAADGQRQWKPKAAGILCGHTPPRAISGVMEFREPEWGEPETDDLAVVGPESEKPVWTRGLARQLAVPGVAPAVACRDASVAGRGRPDRLRLPHLICRFPRRELSSSISGGAGVSFSHLSGV